MSDNTSISPKRSKESARSLIVLGRQALVLDRTEAEKILMKINFRSLEKNL